MRSFARELRVPIMHVTHQRNEARALGDFFVFIDEGQVAASASLDP